MQMIISDDPEVQRAVIDVLTQMDFTNTILGGGFLVLAAIVGMYAIKKLVK